MQAYPPKDGELPKLEYNRTPVPANKVKDIFSTLKGNARAMEILMDELAISDNHTDCTRRFLQGTHLPPGKYHEPIKVASVVTIATP